MLLEIKNLTVAYGLNNKIKFNSMEIDNQKINVIYGENGCGKSTLLKAINDLIPIDSGNILIDNGSKTKEHLSRPIIGLDSGGYNLYISHIRTPSRKAMQLSILLFRISLGKALSN